jgi:hypothetical protein
VQDHPDFGRLRKAPSIFLPVFFLDVDSIQENIGKTSLVINARLVPSIGFVD